MSPNVCVQRTGRLLPVGDSKWVHANCAVWSSGVCEHVPGVVSRLHTVIARARKQVLARNTQQSINGIVRLLDYIVSVLYLATCLVTPDIKRLLAQRLSVYVRPHRQQRMKTV